LFTQPDKSLIVKTKNSFALLKFTENPTTDLRKTSYFCNKIYDFSSISLKALKKAKEENRE
jgi:hypothetical protein